MEEGKTSGGGGGVPAHGTASVAAIAAPVALQGVIGTFDPAQEEWCEYTERLTHYFVASDITSEDKKRAILLTVVGPSAYRLLKTLASPKRLEELRFSELVELAKKHYNPKPSPIVKRFEFNSRSQKEGETIAARGLPLTEISYTSAEISNEILKSPVKSEIFREISKSLKSLPKSAKS